MAGLLVIPVIAAMAALTWWLSVRRDRKLTVTKLCSGTEDGWLWYVVDWRGERVGDGGWLHREDAEMDAAWIRGGRQT
jgi:hypothetical protein